MRYRVLRITAPPKHHFFGYYGMRPWDRTGRYHLVLETEFMDRPPNPGDEATVCTVDLHDEHKIVPLATTRAWNFQQGAMLHWVPPDDSAVLFNDRREGRFVCVMHDLASGAQRVVGPAIGALSRDGSFGATLNFARIARTRPGYGYEGLPDPHADENHPRLDGLGLLDMRSGEVRTPVTIRQVAGASGRIWRLGRGKTWFNHVAFNPSGTRLAFLFRGLKGWRELTCRQIASCCIKGTHRPYGTEMWTVGTDGDNLVRTLSGPMVGHFDWKDDETLIAYASVGSTNSVWEVDAFARTDPAPLFRNVIETDGHICFSRDREWVVTDTYPDKDGQRALSVVNCATWEEISLGRYYSPVDPRLREIRCDLHPSWRDDDRAIGFDGIHEGIRQRYVVLLDPHP